MKPFQSKTSKLVQSLLVFAVFVTRSNGVHLELSENYLLDYCYFTHESICLDGCVWFTVDAINITGWIGLGLNDKSEDMDGADLVMGGKADTFYFGDYHVPKNAGNGLPILDKSQDWTWIDMSENHGSTWILFFHHFNTGDYEEDIEIKNETVHLIWAYNQFSDDVTQRHTQRGSVEVNLLSNLDGCEDEIRFLT